MTKTNQAVPSRKRKIITAGVVIAITVIIVTLLGLAKPEPPVPTLKEEPTLVNTNRLKLSDMTPGFKTVGKIAASAMTEITSQAQGSVARVYVENGEKVEQGQLLIEIDQTEQARLTSQAQAQVTQAQSALEQAKAQHQANIKLLETDTRLLTLANRSLKRYQDLQKRNLATEAQVDQANEIAQRQESSTIQRQTAVDNWTSHLADLEARLKSAEAQLEQTQDNLASTQLKSPFAGRVHQILVAQSGRVNPGTPLITLYSDEDLVLEASIPSSKMAILKNSFLTKTSTESDAKEIEKKLKLTATGSVWGETINFELKTISQRSSGHGGAIGLFKPLNNTDLLAVNRGIEATVFMPQLKETFAIPVTALHDHEYIYLLSEENVLQRRNVEILGESYRDDQRFYIISAQNLPQNTAYATTQMVSDVNGLKVQPVETSENTQK